VNVACRGGVEDGAAHTGLADGEVEAAETAGDEEERDGNETEMIPDQFRLCSSMLEICNWLVNKRPDILNFAY
jgi:hypothetical protein